MKIIAEIPARQGSQRVKNKNMRLLNGKPMISYAINAANESKLLSSVFVNTDSDAIGKYAESCGVGYFKRKEHLASDTATSDDYNYDFFVGTGADILVQINPVCPFVSGDLIDRAINNFIDNNLNSLVTVREENFQAFYDGKPVNFDLNRQLPRTQDLIPIQICSWPVCVWSRESFIESYEKNGHAVFNGKLGLYPVTFLEGIKISYEEDFLLAEKLMYSFS